VSPEGFLSLKVVLTSVPKISLAWREPVDMGGCHILDYVVMVDDGNLG